jgi:hypothetical protein
MSTLLSSSDVSAGFWNDAAEHRIAPKRTRALSAFWGKTWGRSPEEIFRLQAVPRTGPEEHRLPNVPENVVILDVPSFVRSSVEAMLVRGEHLKVVQDIVRLCWDEADVLLRPVPVKTEGACYSISKIRFANARSLRRRFSIHRRFVITIRLD